MLHARQILLGSLPAPPASTNYRANASAALKTMLLNSDLGDCVIASGGHRIGLLTSAAGNPFIYTDAQALKDYEAIGGYKPSDPSSDQGCDMVTNNNYRVATGYADGSKDLGWLAVDATNKTEIMQVIYLFENCDFGMPLPDAWISPFPSADGFVWDVAGAPDDNNGHCVPGVDYTTNGVNIVSWALEGVITWAAIAKYAATSVGGELYVHVSMDQLAKGMAKAPNGVDWPTLIAYFDQMGGNIPLPAPPAPAPVPAPPAPPAPAPTPVPVPPAPAPISGPTLDQAIRWAQGGFAGLPQTMHRTQADMAVKKGLTQHWPKG
jgi:hypothetical protein